MKQRRFFSYKTPYTRIWVKIDGKIDPYSTERDHALGGELKNAVVTAIETWNVNNPIAVEFIKQEIKKNITNITWFQLEDLQIHFSD